MEEDSNIIVGGLFTDEDFLRLSHSYERTNLFDVMGDSFKELWHSSFIRWLLDPKGSHNLKDLPLRLLFSLYLEKQQYNKNVNEMSPKQYFNNDYNTMVIDTERSVVLNNRRGRIDIVGENNQMIFIIENKVKTFEHDDQTLFYYDYIVGCDEYEKKQKYFFYLCADRSFKTVAEDKHYININYQDLYDFVIEKCLDYPTLSAEGKLLLEDYTNNLRNVLPYTNEPMAYPNKALCMKIYEKYKESFELIRKVMTDKNRDKDALVCQVFKKYEKLINEILVSVNQSVIEPWNGEKIIGSQLVKLLCENKKIIPGTRSAVFTYSFLGKTFEVDVIKVENEYKLIAGYYDGDSYDGSAEIPSISWKGKSIFDSPTEAIDSAVFAYKESINNLSPGYSGPGSVGLVNYENKTFKMLGEEL